MSNFLKSILIFVLFLSILIYSLFLWISGDNRYESIVGLEQKLSKLRILDLKRDLLADRISQNYSLDEITSITMNICNLADVFLNDSSILDSKKFVDLTNKLDEKRDLLERYKSYHSAIKNSLAYVFNYNNSAISNNLVSPAMKLSMERILIGYYSNSLSEFKQKYTEDSAVLKEYRKKFHQKDYNPFEDDEKKLVEYELLLAHMNAIVSYYVKIQNVNQKIASLKLEDSFNSVSSYLQLSLNKQENTNRVLMLFMSFSAFIFLLIGVILHYKEVIGLKRVKELTNDLQQFVYALNESAIVSKSDLQGNITFVNERFCKTSGYSREELMGRGHNVVRDPDEPKEIYLDLWKTIENKEIFKATIKNRAKDGSTYYVDSVIIPFLDVDGNIKEYMSVRYDITDVVNAKNRAIEAQRAKDEFLSNMSHELRTPLNAILGFSQILHKKLESQNRKYMGMILDNSRHLLELINDILDLSKIQSGKFEVNLHEFNLTQEAVTLLERIGIQAEQKGINLKYKISDEKLYLRADWLRVSQIITNLVSNAIKFSKKDEDVDVEFLYENENLQITIRDYGIGMSKEVQEKIFEPFIQADSSTTRKYGGTGLGLSIVTQLIELMSGRLELVSEEGKGSEFTIYLPIERLKAK
ncbi:MAG: ATP-binding protein [Campylobacterota bacterium]|nr:ATP-binding protein [Campylobacterota bacterium]